MCCQDHIYHMACNVLLLVFKDELRAESLIF